MINKLCVVAILAVLSSTYVVYRNNDKSPEVLLNDRIRIQRLEVVESGKRCEFDRSYCNNSYKSQLILADMLSE